MIYTEHSTKALSQNKFVYLAIQQVLLLVLEMRGTSDLEAGLSMGLDVTIVGDNDFYSQRAQVIFSYAKRCIMLTSKF